MLAGEELELLKHGYVRYWIVTLYCARDGLLRIALPYEPDDHHTCPICAKACACGVMPSLCFTRRQLPFWNILISAVKPNSWPAEDDEALEAPAPLRVVDADHYVTVNGNVSSLPALSVHAGLLRVNSPIAAKSRRRRAVSNVQKPMPCQSICRCTWGRTAD